MDYLQLQMPVCTNHNTEGVLNIPPLPSAVLTSAVTSHQARTDIQLCSTPSKFEPADDLLLSKRVAVSVRQLSVYGCVLMRSALSDSCQSAAVL